MMSESNLDKLFDALRGLRRSKDKPAKTTEENTGEIYLFVGLGNPGREYGDTRHNIGFLLVDRLAERVGVNFTRTQSKALITAGRYQGNKIVLAKPQTFMNRSGHAVAALTRFYKVPLHNLMIVYDDVDLPFDTIRMKPSGGSAGHKGMNSVIDQLGTQEFPRLRLGVGRAFGSKQAADYVLKPFSKEESEFLPVYLNRAADAALVFTTEGIEQAMTLYNRAEQ
jgi:PTH1 family peptidyl-tRNA hydrolase